MSGNMVDQEDKNMDQILLNKAGSSSSEQPDEAVNDENAKPEKIKKPLEPVWEKPPPTLDEEEKHFYERHNSLVCFDTFDPADLWYFDKNGHHRPQQFNKAGFAST